MNEPSMRGVPISDSKTSVFAALARVNPAKGAASVHQDITLDRGWSFTGTVFGPEGQPLTGSTIMYCKGSGILLGDERMKTATFTGWFNPQTTARHLVCSTQKRAWWEWLTLPKPMAARLTFAWNRPQRQPPG